MLRTLLALAGFVVGTLPMVGSEDQAAYVKLLHVGSGKVLAIEENSDEAGARTVVVKDDDKETSQQWQLVKDGAHLKIVNRKSGKVLDVNEASSEEGAALIQWDVKDEDYDNQRWSWVGAGSERQLKSKSSGLVADVNEEGKLIQKKADEKARGQLWKIVEIKK